MHSLFGNPRKYNPSLFGNPRKYNPSITSTRLSSPPCCVVQVHVEAVRCFLEAAVDRKVAKLVQPSAFKNDLFYV